MLVSTIHRPLCKSSLRGHTRSIINIRSLLQYTRLKARAREIEKTFHIGVQVQVILLLIDLPDFLMA
jgi:hypothetical protein